MKKQNIYFILCVMVIFSQVQAEEGRVEERVVDNNRPEVRDRDSAPRAVLNRLNFAHKDASVKTDGDQKEASKKDTSTATRDRAADAGVEILNTVDSVTDSYFRWQLFSQGIDSLFAIGLPRLPTEGLTRLTAPAWMENAGTWVTQRASGVMEAIRSGGVNNISSILPDVQNLQTLHQALQGLQMPDITGVLESHIVQNIGSIAGTALQAVASVDLGVVGQGAMTILGAIGQVLLAVLH